MTAALHPGRRAGTETDRAETHNVIGDRAMSNSVSHPRDSNREQPDFHHGHCDWDDYEPVSSAVVAAVANATADCPSELDPLYEYVEPNALDELFDEMPDGTRPTVREVTFRYENHLVTVYHDGKIVVEPADA